MVRLFLVVCLGLWFQVVNADPLGGRPQISTDIEPIGPSDVQIPVKAFKGQSTVDHYYYTGAKARTIYNALEVEPRSTHSPATGEIKVVGDESFFFCLKQENQYHCQVQRQPERAELLQLWNATEEVEAVEKVIHATDRIFTKIIGPINLFHRFKLSLPGDASTYGLENTDEANTLVVVRIEKALSKELYHSLDVPVEILSGTEERPTKRRKQAGLTSCIRTNAYADPRFPMEIFPNYECKVTAPAEEYIY